MQNLFGETVARFLFNGVNAQACNNMTEAAPKEAHTSHISPSQYQTFNLCYIGLCLHIFLPTHPTHPTHRESLFAYQKNTHPQVPPFFSTPEFLKLVRQACIC